MGTLFKGLRPAAPSNRREWVYERSRFDPQGTWLSDDEHGGVEPCREKTSSGSQACCDGSPRSWACSF